MKKIFKAIIAAACAGTLCAGVAALTGCDNSKTGEAWGLVHGAGYVGYASITVNGDDVIDAYLNEVCFPTQVTIDETKVSVPDGDKVSVEKSGKTTVYYKTVSYGEVTMTYDATDGYKVGSETLAQYFKNAENAKAYYEAVMNNSVSVTVSGAKKTDVMTKNALCKEVNGYWTRQDENGKNYSRWLLNRDATISYVKEHGVANLLSLVRDAEKGADGFQYWRDGDINTGATWSDLNSKPADGAYYSYAQLLVNAYNATK